MLEDTPSTEDRYSDLDELQLDALLITQSEGRSIYAFGMNGKHIPRFADVSRARREEGDVSLLGYQRPEVRKHIAEIREYIDSAGAMIPNAIVLALGDGVTFRPKDGKEQAPDGDSTPGHLFIPCARDGEEKVGFVVDGQQRLAAIRQSERENFPMFVIAFTAKTDEEQRKQFLLVNATKPLPRGLIHELLPGTRGHLPRRLQKRKLPAELVAHLNHTPGSPLEGAIRTATMPSGRIADNSMLRTFEDSLSDGILWELAQTVDGEDAPVDQMYAVLSEFWWAVRTVWGSIWALKPRQSRLLHGAGIVSLGYLMEEMISRFPGPGMPDRSWFIDQLGLIADACRWTEGVWHFGDGSQRRWDEVQNIDRDVMMVANHLTRLYRLRVRRCRTAGSS